MHPVLIYNHIFRLQPRAFSCADCSCNTCNHPYIQCVYPRIKPATTHIYNVSLQNTPATTLIYNVSQNTPATTHIYNVSLQNTPATTLIYKVSQNTPATTHIYNVSLQNTPATTLIYNVSKNTPATTLIYSVSQNTPTTTYIQWVSQNKTCNHPYKSILEYTCNHPYIQNISKNIPATTHTYIVLQNTPATTHLYSKYSRIHLQPPIYTVNILEYTCNHPVIQCVSQNKTCNHPYIYNVLQNTPATTHIYVTIQVPRFL